MCPTYQGLPSTDEGNQQCDLYEYCVSKYGSTTLPLTEWEMISCTNSPTKKQYVSGSTCQGHNILLWWVLDREPGQGVVLESPLGQCLSLGVDQCVKMLQRLRGVVKKLLMGQLQPRDQRQLLFQMTIALTNGNRSGLQAYSMQYEWVLVSVSVKTSNGSMSGMDRVSDPISCSWSNLGLIRNFTDTFLCMCAAYIFFMTQTLVEQISESNITYCLFCQLLFDAVCATIQNNVRIYTDCKKGVLNPDSKF